MYICIYTYVYIYVYMSSFTHNALLRLY
jgi:hypothetical protein